VQLDNLFDELVEAIGSRRSVVWIAAIGITCLFAAVVLTSGVRHKRHAKSAASFSEASPSPAATEKTDDRSAARRVENPTPLPTVAKGPFSSPPADKKFLEARQRMLPALNSQLREETKGLYGALFQQLQLSGSVQEKVIDILTQQQKKLEEEAFEAAQSGKIPTPPSPEILQTQQIEEAQQLRSLLGDAGLAEFNQYQGTIPDRIIVNSMNQEQANLSDSQAQQLLQILTEERQQIFGQSGITQSLGSMSSDQAMTTIQQQQDLLQQAVNNRIQNLLTAEQRTTLQGILSQYSILPKNE
jgi:hypothetical protein